MKDKSVNRIFPIATLLYIATNLTACNPSVSQPGTINQNTISQNNQKPNPSGTDLLSEGKVPPSTSPVGPISPGGSSLPNHTGNGTGVQPPSGNAQSSVANLRLNAASRFLSAKGESLKLQVELFDAKGQIVPEQAGLVWSSSRPQDFSVDPSGKVTALTEIGFSEIGVRLAGTELKASLIINVLTTNELNSSGSSTTEPANDVTFNGGFF